MVNAPTPVAGDDTLLEQVGIALSRLRRRSSSGRRDLTRNLVLNVVADSLGEITVGGIADEMGVSQPVSSRAIAACIAEGLVSRTTSQSDGRRTVVKLTEAGEAERTRLAAEQRDTFTHITATWDPDERRQFAHYLIRYSHDAANWLPQMYRQHDNARPTKADSDRSIPIGG